MKKFLHLSLLTSFTLVISLIESYFSFPLFVPGAKLGLANILLMSTLYLYGVKEALIVSFVRSVLLVLFTGQITVFMYSMPAGLSAVVAMFLSKKYISPVLSPIGVSIFGSLTHNVTQLLVASGVLGTWKVFYYYPFISLIAIVTGIFVGMSAQFLNVHLAKISEIKKRL